MEFALDKVDKVENEGVVLPKVTFRPAELACMAGELDLDTEGDALLRLVIEGEFLGPGEPPEAAVVMEGECRMPGEPTEGERMAAWALGRPGRQCLTDSEPDWESLLLLGEPGEETITWRGLSEPPDEDAAAWGPTRGDSGR